MSDTWRAFGEAHASPGARQTGTLRGLMNCGDDDGDSGARGLE
jgi:hypothetical protein